MPAPTPPDENTRPLVHHVHRRDWRPCPVTLPPPIVPRKEAAIWLFEFADAIQVDVLFERFVARWPEEFPNLCEEAA